MKKRLLRVGVLGAAIVVAARKSREARRQRATRPADVGFMFAMHAAMRRDLERLHQTVGHSLDQGVLPETVHDGWAVLRRQIESHHQAEDDDLWPILRVRVASGTERGEIDEMTSEHARILPALDAVDHALAGRASREQAAAELNRQVLDHLDHEERSVLPLVEAHLTDAQWYAFLRLERGKHSPRERVEFLAWVLDDAPAEHAAAVLRELPAPGRLVYRYIIKPRYDARRLWSLDPPDLRDRADTGQAPTYAVSSAS